MTEHEELLGADFFEHDIRHPGVGVSRAISVLKHYDDGIDCTIAPDTINKGYIHCRKIINIYIYSTSYILLIRGYSQILYCTYELGSRSALSFKEFLSKGNIVEVV